MKTARKRALGAWLLGIGVGAWLLIAGDGARAEGDRNACGCYRDSAGSCYCDKKAKCGCPGECEPKGCEEKRQKQLEKEIEAETKRAQQGQGHKQGGDRSGDEAAGAKPAKGSRPAGPRMSAAQKRELSRLLGLYVGEHPDGRGKTVDQVIKETAAP